MQFSIAVIKDMEARGAVAQIDLSKYKPYKAEENIGYLPKTHIK